MVARKDGKMELPKSIKKLKPNQVVVFDRYYPVSDFKANAFAITDDGDFMFFDTTKYYTDGKVDFYGEH